MRAVVVGGTGFLGGAIVDELLVRGHDVAAVSPSAPPVGAGRLHLHTGDLGRPETIVPMLRDADVVVLATGRTVPGNARTRAVDELWSQVHGTLALIDHLAVERPTARLVYLSSAGGLAAGGSAPFEESDRPSPWSTYGALKLAVEAFIGARDRELGRESLVIRPTNPFGPGQRLDKPQGFIAHACAALLSGRRVELWDDPSTERDWLYVDDFARCAASAIEADTTGVLHVGAGDQHSLAEVLRLLGEVAGVEVDVTLVPRGRPPSPATLPVSNERARRELGWEPRVSLPEGVERLWRRISGAESATSGLDVRQPLRR